MKPVCPRCGRPMPPDQVNVATDVARCPACGEVSVLSKLVAGETDGVARVDLDRPPSGVRYVPRPGGFELTATTRSAAAFLLVPFMCAWSGFVFGGIYGKQILQHHFDLSTSLFGIPFVLGAVLFGSLAAMMVVGRQVLRVDGDEASLFTGVGSIGWTRRIDLSSVVGVGEVVASGRRNSRELMFDGPNPFSFGSMLRSDRRAFIQAALRQALRDRRKSRR